MKLSNKHGINASMSVCFFCGKDKEILLLGKLKGDAKAPTRVVANYDPCNECQEKMKQGRLVMEVSTVDSGALPIVKGAWPTGRWCIISFDAAEKLFKDGRKAPVLINQQMYEALMRKKQ